MILALFVLVFLFDGCYWVWVNSHVYDVWD